MGSLPTVWVGVGAVVGVVVLVMGVWFAGRSVRVFGRRPALCPRCDYELGNMLGDGVEEVRCPECGKAYGAARVARGRVVRSWRGLVGGVVGAGVGAVLMVAGGGEFWGRGVVHSVLKEEWLAWLVERGDEAAWVRVMELYADGGGMMGSWSPGPELADAVVGRVASALSAVPDEVLFSEGWPAEAEEMADVAWTVASATPMNVSAGVMEELAVGAIRMRLDVEPRVRAGEMARVVVDTLQLPSESVDNVVSAEVGRSKIRAVDGDGERRFGMEGVSGSSMIRTGGYGSFSTTLRVPGDIEVGRYQVLAEVSVEFRRPPSLVSGSGAVVAGGRSVPAGSRVVSERGAWFEVVGADASIGPAVVAASEVTAQLEDRFNARVRLIVRDDGSGGRVVEWGLLYGFNDLDVGEGEFMPGVEDLGVSTKGWFALLIDGVDLASLTEYPMKTGGALEDHLRGSALSYGAQFDAEQRAVLLELAEAVLAGEGIPDVDVGWDCEARGGTYWREERPVVDGLVEFERVELLVTDEVSGRHVLAVEGEDGGWSLFEMGATPRGGVLWTELSDGTAFDVDEVR